jgi:hypothetical protein
MMPRDAIRSPGTPITLPDTLEHAAPNYDACASYVLPQVGREFFKRISISANADPRISAGNEIF